MATAPTDHASTLSFELIEGASRTEVLEWLRERVSLPLEVLWVRGSGGEPRLYGRVSATNVWLGVFRPGRLVSMQRLFRGRLSLHEGRWRLEGRMRLTISGWSRVLLPLGSGVALAPLQPGLFAAAACACGALAAGGLWAWSLALGRKDAEIIGRLLRTD